MQTPQCYVDKHHTHHPSTSAHSLFRNSHCKERVDKNLTKPNMVIKALPSLFPSILNKITTGHFGCILGTTGDTLPFPTHRSLLAFSCPGLLHPANGNPHRDPCKVHQQKHQWALLQECLLVCTWKPQQSRTETSISTQRALPSAQSNN